MAGLWQHTRPRTSHVIPALIKTCVDAVDSGALTGFCGTIAWDTARPDGQPRRPVDTSRAATKFGFAAKMPNQEGLRRTVEWYRQSLVVARSRFAAVG